MQDIFSLKWEVLLNKVADDINLAGHFILMTCEMLTVWTWTIENIRYVCILLLFY